MDVLVGIWEFITGIGPWFMRVVKVFLRVTRNEKAIAELQDAIAAKPKKPTVLKYGIRWAPSDTVPGENDPMCAYCEADGRQCPLLWDNHVHKNGTTGMLEVSLKCVHQSHGLQWFTCQADKYHDTVQNSALFTHSS